MPGCPGTSTGRGSDGGAPRDAAVSAAGRCYGRDAGVYLQHAGKRTAASP